MKLEIWKDIEGYEGLYQISNFGNVRNNENHILKQGTYSNGYKFVALRPIKNQKHWSVHRLVASAFIPNTENKPCFNHKDGKRDNNHIENLEWCTHSENIYHSRTKGKAKFCYIEKPVEIKNISTGEIMYFKNTKLLCEFFGHTKCWLGNKRKQVGTPFEYEGWVIE